MKKKICARCLKEILKNQDYLKVILYEKEKITEEKFIHKNCWDVEINQRALMQKSMNMLQAAEGFMAESGMFPKVVNI